MLKHHILIHLMAMLIAHSLNSTTLNDRILWFDGTSTVSPRYLETQIGTGTDITSLYVDKISNDIRKYNVLVPIEKQITIKEEVTELSFEWQIPLEYKQIDVVEFVRGKLHEIDGQTSDIELRETRLAEELLLYKKLKLYDAIRTLIYIINTFNDKNIIWGVGRGSSVSSYVLYLIGVHDVDSFKYGLNINDFIRI